MLSLGAPRLLEALARLLVQPKPVPFGQSAIGLRRHDVQRSELRGSLREVGGLRHLVLTLTNGCSQTTFDGTILYV